MNNLIHAHVQNIAKGMYMSIDNQFNVSSALVCAYLTSSIQHLMYL